MKGGYMSKLSKKQAREIKNLATTNDEDIDLSDQPEVRDWTESMVGKFYRPIKKPLTIRVDADVLAWLKAQGKGYQTRINNLLRTAMQNQNRRRRA
jgi:uncharacterized protein (DUF4415 family)